MGPGGHGTRDLSRKFAEIPVDTGLLIQCKARVLSFGAPRRKLVAQGWGGRDLKGRLTGMHQCIDLSAQNGDRATE
jgi:hypothetical protein